MELAPLCWVTSGMRTGSVRQVGRTRSVFIRQLTEQGFDPAAAEQLANQAVEMGQITTETSDTHRPIYRIPSSVLKQSRRR